MVGKVLEWIARVLVAFPDCKSVSAYIVIFFLLQVLIYSTVRMVRDLNVL